MAEYDGWADFYDIVHPGLPGEAEFYVGQAVRARSPVLELGCGTGRIAIPMAMSGVDVTGLDLSEGMLDQCREKLKAVGDIEGSLTLVQADMADFQLDRTFGFIAMPYRTFMHLMSPTDQRACLRCIHRHLDDDGVAILNLWAAKPSAVAPHLSRREDEMEYVGRYPVPGTELSVLDHCGAVYDELTQRLTEVHELNEIDGDGEILGTETLTLTRTWVTHREMDNLVRLCGFDVEAVFGDFDCSPFGADSTEMIWVLKKG